MDSLLELQEFSFFFCNLGDKDAVRIANALFENHRVSSIELSQNHIGEEGAIQLFSAVEDHPLLSSIRIEGNQIGDEGAAALAQALLKNRTITSVALGGNHIGKEGAAKLANSLCRNPVVTQFDLRGNYLQPEEEIRLRMLAELNQKMNLIWELFDTDEIFASGQFPSSSSSSSSSPILKPSSLSQSTSDSLIEWIKSKLSLFSLSEEKDTKKDRKEGDEAFWDWLPYDMVVLCTTMIVTEKQMIATSFS